MISYSSSGSILRPQPCLAACFMGWQFANAPCFQMLFYMAYLPENRAAPTLPLSPGSLDLMITLGNPEPQLIQNDSDRVLTFSAPEIHDLNRVCK